MENTIKVPELTELVDIFHQGSEQLKKELKGKLKPNQSIFERRSLAFWVIHEYLTAKEVRGFTQCQVYILVDTLMVSIQEEEQEGREID